MAAARIDTLLLSETVAKRTVALKLCHMASTYSLFQDMCPSEPLSPYRLHPKAHFRSRAENCMRRTSREEGAQRLQNKMIMNKLWSTILSRKWVNLEQPHQRERDFH